MQRRKNRIKQPIQENKKETQPSRIYDDRVDYYIDHRFCIVIDQNFEFHNQDSINEELEGSD